MHLESDTLLSTLTPRPTHAPAECDRFYEVLADLAALVSEQALPVVVDAAAPRRIHRERARRKIGRFLEVFVDTPRKVREARDPKGLYRLTREGRAPQVSGATEPYEKPPESDVIVAGYGDPAESAQAILDSLRERRWLARRARATSRRSGRGAAGRRCRRSRVRDRLRSARGAP